MKLVTTIDINDIPTEVLVEYRILMGEPEILFMTDIHTGDAVAPDLLGETDNIALINELHESWCDEQAEKSLSRSLGGFGDRCGKLIRA